jgi:hemerythrin-like metal-binding protein
MDYMAWQPALEVGFAKIDEDHRELIAALNRLHAAMDQGQDKEELAKVLNFLRDYTVSHFQTEEALMIKYGYPGASAHFAAHSELVLKVCDFIVDYRAGRAALTEALLDFLETWLVGHILGQDHELGAYLRARGVVAA